MAGGPAADAGLDDEAVLGGRIPPRLRVRAHPRHRHRVGEPPRLAHAASPRASTSALAGTPAALVTSTVSHPATWSVDSPRSCRTPSTTWLSPWMYASESEP